MPLSLKHRDIIGTIQVGRSGLGTGKFTSVCSSTNKQKRHSNQRNRMVEQEKRYVQYSVVIKDNVSDGREK